MAVTNRYEILEILNQDRSGVSFHATDRETGKEVVLRRFFPFGPEGGGLEDEEKIAYDVGVKRLRQIAHPALRKIVDGGTDPVDGMPFLVTEWLEGEMLSSRLNEGSLSSESVRTLADLALETSQILSEAFGEEAIWVETDPATIIISDDDPDRPITFWICPIRWLGHPSARSNLKPLLEMVEDLCDWHGQVISRNSGGGLGAWVKTLRDKPDIWNLAQARAALHEPATLVEASAAHAAASPTVHPEVRQQAILANRPVIWPWILASLLAFSAAGILAWKRATPPTTSTQVVGTANNPTQEAQAKTTEASPAVTADSKRPNSPPKPDTPKRESAVEAMNRRAAEMAAQAEGNALITLGEKATIEGEIIHTESSNSDKSHYFQVKTTKGGQLLWVMFRSADWEDFDLSTLGSMKGKHARLTGRWTSESGTRKNVLRMSATRQLELLD